MVLKMLEDEYSGKTPDRTIKNEKCMVKSTIEQPYPTTLNTFLSTCHPVTHTSFVMHPICEYVWTLETDTFKTPLTKLQNEPRPPQPAPPSPSEHLSFGTSLWFLPDCDHVAAFGEFCPPSTRVRMWTSELVNSTLPICSAEGSRWGFSTFTPLWVTSVGWCWQSVMQSVSQSVSLHNPSPEHTLFLNLKYKQM